MLNDYYPLGFKLALHRDLSIALEAAQQAGLHAITQAVQEQGSFDAGRLRRRCVGLRRSCRGCELTHAKRCASTPSSRH